MKKLLMGAALVMAAHAASAQGFVKFSTGYALSAGSDATGITTTVDGNGDETTEQLRNNAANGLNLRLDGGYTVKGVSFGLGAHYLLGFESLQDEWTETDTDYTYSEKTNSKTSQLRLIPSVQYNVQMEESALTPYARIGLVIPVMGTTTVTETVDETDGTDVYADKMVMDVKGGFSLGFEGAVGFNYALSDNLSLGLDVTYTALRINANTAEVKSYDITVNGTTVDGLDGASTMQTQINFVDKIDKNSNTMGSANPNTEEPVDMLGSNSNFNSLGVNLGVKYNF